MLINDCLKQMTNDLEKRLQEQCLLVAGTDNIETLQSNGYKLRCEEIGGLKNKTERYYISKGNKDLAYVEYITGNIEEENGKYSIKFTISEVNLLENLEQINKQ